MHTKSILHRHFVAAPLLPVFLAASLFFSQSTATPVASVQSISGEESQVIRHPTGVSALIDPGSIIDFDGDVPELKEGALRMAGEGEVSLIVGTSKILGIQGGFHAVKHGDALTVSALTTPVLLTSREAHQLLIPIGKSWRGSPADLQGLNSGVRVWKEQRVVQVLPQEFLEKEHGLLLSLAPELPERLPDARTFAPLSPLEPSLIRFAAANKRAGQEWKRAVWGHLRFLTERSEVERIESLFRDAKTTPAFEQSAELASVAATLLALSEDPRIDLMLLPLLALCESCMTVASAHPDIRNAYWAVPPALPTNDEAALIRLLSLPISDTEKEAVPGFAVERWQAQFEEFLKARKNPYALLNDAGVDLANLIEWMESVGYPERSLRYGSVLLALTKDAEDHLSPELAASLQHLRALQKVDIRPSSLEEEPAQSNVKMAAPETYEHLPTTTPFVPQEVITRATNLLKRAGALFSMKTKVTAVDALHAHVEGILFATPQGDLLFDFDVNLQTTQVESILHNGELLPFPMDLDKFVTWVREARNALIPGEE